MFAGICVYKLCKKPVQSQLINCSWCCSLLCGARKGNTQQLSVLSIYLAVQIYWNIVRLHSGWNGGASDGLERAHSIYIVLNYLTGSLIFIMKIIVC